MMVGIVMISVGMVVQSESNQTSLNTIKVEEFNTKNMATSVRMAYKVSTTEKREEEPQQEATKLKKIKMETAPASLLRVEVYEGKTLEEVAAQLNRSLGGILAGHGYTIAAHSIDLGVDPYLAAAIMIHETGNGTSNIANNCYNFGGQKGYGCGAYKKYDTIDAGLNGIIDNLYKNYYVYGLNTVESIGHKYAESTEWPTKIHGYINKLKSR